RLNDHPPGPPQCPVLVCPCLGAVVFVHLCESQIHRATGFPTCALRNRCIQLMVQLRRLLFPYRLLVSSTVSYSRLSSLMHWSYWQASKHVSSFQLPLLLLCDFVYSPVFVRQPLMLKLLLRRR